MRVIDRRSCRVNKVRVSARLRRRGCVALLRTRPWYSIIFAEWRHRPHGCGYWHPLLRRRP